MVLFTKGGTSWPGSVVFNVCARSPRCALLARLHCALSVWRHASSCIIPVHPAVTTQAILTVGDTVPLTGTTTGQTYRMVGIPDGLGAFDNGDGTFTLLMNHELGNTVGVTRAHGSIGAFVSEWVIDKATLQVLSGQDLMQQVFLWDAATQSSSTTPSTFAFNRFCSADLAPVSALYFDPTPGSPNSGDEVGTTARIYLNGEEGGATGFQVAHVVTGPDAHKSYVLGKFNLSTNGNHDGPGGAVDRRHGVGEHAGQPVPPAQDGRRHRQRRRHRHHDQRPDRLR